MDAAVRRAEGARWACALCRVLDVLVERDHCTKTLDPAEIELPAALRAGAALLALLGLLIWAGHMLPRWLF